MTGRRKGGSLRKITRLNLGIFPSWSVSRVLQKAWPEQTDQPTNFRPAAGAWAVQNNSNNAVSVARSDSLFQDSKPLNRRLSVRFEEAAAALAADDEELALGAALKVMLARRMLRAFWYKGG
jgi:hypothetical protein